MKSKSLPLLFLLLFTLFSQAQPRFSDVEIELGSSMFMNKGVREVFPAGINFFIGPKWILDLNEKLFLKGAVGAKWYMQKLPDDYLEHLGTLRIGPEFQYKFQVSDHLTMRPTLKIDYAWCTNFDTEGGLYQVIQEEPAYVLAERYMRGWGIGTELGVKVAFREKWFIRFSYEVLNARFKILNRDLQGDLGKNYIDRQQKSLELSTLNLTVGIHLYN